MQWYQKPQNNEVLLTKCRCNGFSPCYGAIEIVVFIIIIIIIIIISTMDGHET